MGIFRGRRPHISQNQQRIDTLAAKLVTAQLKGELRSGEISQIKNENGQLSFQVGSRARATVSPNGINTFSITLNLPDELIALPIASDLDVMNLIEAVISMLGQ
ncbi:MAG: hypothetical protein ACYCU8_00955 [Ferrimicrobium acidiphilum]